MSLMSTNVGFPTGDWPAPHFGLLIVLAIIPVSNVNILIRKSVCGDLLQESPTTGRSNVAERGLSDRIEKLLL